MVKEAEIGDMYVYGGKRLVSYIGLADFFVNLKNREEIFALAKEKGLVIGCKIKIINEVKRIKIVDITQDLIEDNALIDMLKFRSVHDIELRKERMITASLKKEMESLDDMTMGQIKRYCMGSITKRRLIYQYLSEKLVWN